MKPLSLDDQIQQAEALLVERQARLRGNGAAVAAGVRRSMPLWLGGTVLAVLGAALGSRWLRRSSAAASGRSPGSSPGTPPDASRTGGQPRWAPWIALGWPLLPARLRGVLGPAEGVPLLAFTLTLLQKAFSPPAAQHPPLQTKPQVDLQR